MKKEAFLYDKIDNDCVECCLCGHGCAIISGSHGLCRVRKNENGILYTMVYGRAVACSMDPVEKKPLYHFLPGTYTYSIATVGCNFKCSFCQNWNISQAGIANTDKYRYSELLPDNVVKAALAEDAKSISYTYTEPTIFFEYAYDTAKVARKSGIKNIFVTNGYMTERAIEMIAPYLDAANVDLKFFNDSSYKKFCSASLKPVLSSIKQMKESGIWVEITTLIIPGLNDTDEELNSISKFISEVDACIPWHISRFFPNYEMTDKEPTSVSILDRAEVIGRENGLVHIYPGNTSGTVTTRCRECGKDLIVRDIYSIVENLVDAGKCPYCSSEVCGIWK